MPMFRTVTVASMMLAVATPAAAQCVTAHSEGVFIAPYEVVYETIIDTAAYPDWNPYILAVDPSDADLTLIGETFTLTVQQPLSGTIENPPEIVTGHQAPSHGSALVAYSFNDPYLAPALGFPERTQSLTDVFGFLTYYETEETFCGPLVAFIPTDDVQEGFDQQTWALGVESFKRWLGF